MGKRGVSTQSVISEVGDTERAADEIVRLAREGGEAERRAAAGAAIRLFFSDVLRHVRARIPGEAAALEDILQEVALAVVEGLHAVRAGAALRSWILHIASNKVCDHLRRRVRDRARGEARLGQAVLDHLVDENASFERLLERAGDEQLAAYLRRALDRLKPRHRDVLTRAYLHGESIDALVTTLGLKPDAVAALLYRARGALGQLLARDAAMAAASTSRPDEQATPVIPLLRAVRKC